MLHTLPLKELTIGMYIADPGPTWVSDGLYPVEGFISTKTELEFILQSGSPFALIDTSRSKPESLPKDFLKASSKSEEEKKHLVANARRSVHSLKDEVAKARAVYEDSLSHAKSILEKSREGVVVHPLEAEPVVSGIVESLDNNSDALLGLCKLRKTDEYTYSHCASVSVLAVMFAKKLGLSKEMQTTIGLGALFHDIGKAKIPLSIINAPRKLTEQEFAIMKYHPLLGYEQLMTLTDMPCEILQIVIEHHEKINGCGYPKGLRCGQISEVGTLVGIVDVFDALTTKRPYKDAMPMYKANSILYSMRDIDFPKAMVDSFIQMIGIYPLGSPVQLSDDSLGLVSGTNSHDPIRPKVILLRDAKGHNIMQKEVDLTVDQNLSIKKIISQKDLGFEVTSILGLPIATKK